MSDPKPTPTSSEPAPVRLLSPTPDSFYVSSMPVPSGLGRFLRIFVPASLWLLALVAFVVSRSQTDPGPAIWNDGVAKQVDGHLFLMPYPVLVERDAAGTTRTHLLVEVGKHAVRRDLTHLVGRRVTVSAWTLERDGRRMLELEPDASAIRAYRPSDTDSTIDQSAPSVPPQPQALGVVTLRGEIVDSKCFLGAMKPGDSKTHKACATLCIRGGIPPMLVTPSVDGRRDYLLLTDADGGALGDWAWPLIAEPVSVTGELEELADIRRLRVQTGAIRRVAEIP